MRSIRKKTGGGRIYPTHWATYCGRSAGRCRGWVNTRSGWFEDDMVNIDREHPEYVAKKAMWKKYRDLYVGGEQMRECAAEYLVRRHKEPNDIYAERLSRGFYENYMGSIIDRCPAAPMRGG